MAARRKLIPLFIPHAGCPNQCVFCNQRRISGSLVPADAHTVTSALDALREEKGYELCFYGGSFTAIPVSQQEELLSAAQPYRETGLIESIRVSTRPDAIDEERLARLRRYGVQTVELGAQSMNDRVLTRSGRGHTAEDVRRSARLVKEWGFTLVLQLMTGLPGETRESARESALKAAELCPDAVRLYPTVIIRDTPLYDAWQAGEYREHTVEEAVEVCADLLPLFEERNIPVIRLGLNPTEELSGGDAAGGAYHPALGELVRSRLYRRRAEELLCAVPSDSAVTLLVGRGKLSQMNGQKRENLLYLRDKFALSSLRTEESDAVSAEGCRVALRLDRNG